MSEVVTRDELLENEIIALNWPLIVGFVASWITENAGPDVDGLVVRWREEMGA